MKKLMFITLGSWLLWVASCNNNASQSNNNAANQPLKYGGFNSEEQWGEHLVKSIGCTECHTPKKVTAQGVVFIDSLYLSGYREGSQIPDLHLAEIEKSGQILGNDEWTAFAGPWGVSFAANITSDATGIGNWDIDNFMRAIRAGKYMGLESSRQLLLPMPWHDFANFSDDELKAMFAYLKTVKPVHNVIHAPIPPLAVK